MTSLSAVVGLGEVGRPLFELIEHCGQPVVGIDIEPAALPGRGSVEIMHICFPFEIPDFHQTVARYIEALAPSVTVINSTVGVGTTRAIIDRTGARIVHSPVRGKHAHMFDELLAYTKYVGGVDSEAIAVAVAHFESLGIRTKTLAAPEATELAKLSETTYFGLLIAWAQEVERFCDRLDLNYDEVVSFYDEVSFFPPVKYFPGVIGGHCVLPNIEILSKLVETPLLQAIQHSNELKTRRDQGPDGKSHVSVD